MRPPSTHSRRRVLLGSAASVLMLIAGACSSGGSELASDTADTSRGEVALFDATVVHDLDLTFDEGDFDEMVATYESTGEKTWIEATVVVDGTTYEQAGVRLKGNSSLRGAAQSSPEELPWLVRLDKYVDGQTHQRYEDIVVRSNSTATSLNEAVALDLLDEAGLASVSAAPARFTVNGSDVVLRLIVEHPDDDEWYETAFDAAGALYKSESTGDWSYRGDDPDSYTDVFDQEGGKDVADLTPLIEFLQFVEESDDETFASELPEQLDVEAFATYLAMMELVGNFDDIDGPGNNSYLWWDAEAEQFTVVPWDLNLAFGVSFGGGREPGGGGPGGPSGNFEPPEGFEPPSGDFEPPDGFEPPAGDFEGGPPGGGPGAVGRGPGGGFGRSNPLVERFHATEEFEALYQERLSELREELVDSGRAQELLTARTDVLLAQADDLVEEATIRSESEAIDSALT